jgi:DnaJ-class molecular chaperone
MVNFKAPIIYDDEGEAIELPFRIALCPECGGRGTTTRHIEPDGGGFTASEWAEACGDDDEFADNYFSGRYDRPCDECDGAGRIAEPDERQMSPTLRKLYREDAEMMRELRAEERAEREAEEGWARRFGY